MDYFLSRLPGVGRFTGPRHFQIFKNFAPSLALFGTSVGLYFLYITDWKLSMTEQRRTIRLYHFNKLYPYERSIKP
ncbi:unnamed protein product [Rotaria magnacalcarata]